MNKELLKELEQIEGKITQYKEERKTCQFCDLTETVTKHGKDKGQLVGATPAQYKRFTGRNADPKGLVNGKIPYNFFLDQLIEGNKITGYKGDQVDKLKDDIERAYNKSLELDKLKGQRDSLIKRINKEGGEKEKVLVSKYDKQACDVTKTDDCKVEIHTGPDAEVELKRQPSFWTVKDVETNQKINDVRYAKEARSIAKLITEPSKPDKKEKIKPVTRRRSDRGIRRMVSITPKRPKLRR